MIDCMLNDQHYSVASLPQDTLVGDDIRDRVYGISHKPLLYILMLEHHFHDGRLRHIIDRFRAGS